MAGGGGPGLGVGCRHRRGGLVSPGGGVRVRGGQVGLQLRDRRDEAERARLRGDGVAVPAGAVAGVRVDRQREHRGGSLLGGDGTGRPVVLQIRPQAEVRLVVGRLAATGSWSAGSWSAGSWPALVVPPAWLVSPAGSRRLVECRLVVRRLVGCRLVGCRLVVRRPVVRRLAVVRLAVVEAVVGGLGLVVVRVGAPGQVGLAVQDRAAACVLVVRVDRDPAGERRRGHRAPVRPLVLVGPAGLPARLLHRGGRTGSPPLTGLGALGLGGRLGRSYGRPIPVLAVLHLLARPLGGLRGRPAPVGVALRPLGRPSRRPAPVGIVLRPLGRSGERPTLVCAVRSLGGLRGRPALVRVLRSLGRSGGRPALLRARLGRLGAVRRRPTPVGLGPGLLVGSGGRPAPVRLVVRLLGGVLVGSGGRPAPVGLVVGLLGGVLVGSGGRPPLVRVRGLVLGGERPGRRLAPVSVGFLRTGLRLDRGQRRPRAAHRRRLLGRLHAGRRRAVLLAALPGLPDPSPRLGLQHRRADLARDRRVVLTFGGERARRQLDESIRPGRHAAPRRRRGHLARRRPAQLPLQRAVRGVQQPQRAARGRRRPRPAAPPSAPPAAGRSRARRGLRARAAAATRRPGRRRCPKGRGRR